MDCTPLDDYCKLHSETVEIVEESKSDKPTEIGVFNGKRYSFMMVEGTPVISIENENPSSSEKVTFLMER